MDLEEKTLKKVEHNQNIIHDLLEKLQILSDQVKYLNLFRDALLKRGGILEGLSEAIVQVIVNENETTRNTIRNRIEEGSIDVISGLTSIINTNHKEQQKEHKEEMKSLERIERRLDFIDKKIDDNFEKLSKKI